MLQDEFIFPVHVFVEDTDFGGVVYHANYLKYMERARTTWGRDLGMGFDKLAEQHIYFVVRSAQLEYLAPARLHDNLQVFTRIAKIGRTSITFHQEIRRTDNPDVLVCTGLITIVCIGENLKPRAFPEQLQERLKQ